MILTLATKDSLRAQINIHSANAMQHPLLQPEMKTLVPACAGMSEQCVLDTAANGNAVHDDSAARRNRTHGNRPTDSNSSPWSGAGRAAHAARADGGIGFRRLDGDSRGEGYDRKRGNQQDAHVSLPILMRQFSRRCREWHRDT
jgi:hypothetical protein